MKTEMKQKTRADSGLFEMETDTIAAIATPPGTGGVAIIRISGPQALDVLHRLVPAHGQAQPGMMVYGDILDGVRRIDGGYGVFFRGPHSYTGEDTAEVQCHGGTVVTRMVLAAALRAGARAAQPGEFTKRAFLNGRMDLSQAEAVGDLIGAVSSAGAELARRNIEGALKERLVEVQDRLTDVLAQLEAALEYPDEDLVDSEAADVLPLLEETRALLSRTAATWGKGHILREGLRVVLVGSPNAGKSTLFNALCRKDRSIVTTIPGTTRDVVEAPVFIDGMAILLADTAGLHRSDDPVESEGMVRTRAAVEESDVILFLVDGSLMPDTLSQELAAEMRRSGKEIFGVLTKSDLPQAMSVEEFAHFFSLPFVTLSAQTADGLSVLEEKLYAASGGNALAEETVLISDLRQKEQLETACAHLDAAIQTLQGYTPDLACVDLRGAWTALGTIVGNTADEEIIDRVFSKFCLGK